MDMKIKIRSEEYMPSRAHPTDAGLDLRAYIPFAHHVAILHPACDMSVDTGCAVSIPPGFVGLVFSRSGMGKHGVTLANSVGVIDSGYTGNIMVRLINHGTEQFRITDRDRIAQLVIVPIVTPDLVLVQQLDDTERGCNGFGSTGDA